MPLGTFDEEVRSAIRTTEELIAVRSAALARCLSERPLGEAKSVMNIADATISHQAALKLLKRARRLLVSYCDTLP